MKRFLLAMALVVPMLALSGCGGDDEPDNSVNTVNPDKAAAVLSISDETVGLRQIFVLTIDYKTDNPNILVTWFDNGEKLNQTPLSELDYAWRADKLGRHTLKAAITDKEKIIYCSLMVNVTECDLCRGILGDSKEKIKLTLGVDSDADMLKTVASNVTEQYFFKENRLYKIYREQNVAMTPQTKIDFTYPYNMFQGLFETYSAKFGTPYSENFTQLDSSEDAIVAYGGYIYSGSMQISARFMMDGIDAEIWVGPCRSGQIGFNLSEQVETE